MLAEHKLRIQSDIAIAEVNHLVSSLKLSINDEDGISQTILKCAESEDSPLHNYFDWDDTSAAEKYRQNQARQFYRSVKYHIVVINELPKIVNVNVRHADPIVLPTLPEPPTKPLSRINTNTQIAPSRFTQKDLIGNSEPIALHNQILNSIRDLNNLLTCISSDNFKPSEALLDELARLYAALTELKP